MALLGYTGDLRVAVGRDRLGCLGWMGVCVCVCVCAACWCAGCAAGCAYTEGWGDASAQPLPVFGVVAVCPLEQGGVEAEVV